MLPSDQEIETLVGFRFITDLELANLKRQWVAEATGSNPAYDVLSGKTALEDRVEKLETLLAKERARIRRVSREIDQIGEEKYVTVWSIRTRLRKALE